VTIGNPSKEVNGARDVAARNGMDRDFDSVNEVVRFYLRDGD
jgi:hypothetical protein